MKRFVYCFLISAFLLTNINSGFGFRTAKAIERYGPGHQAMEEKTLLALGDSYTIGESVEEADRFPNIAVKKLRLKGIPFSYPATIIAKTGWTTDDLLDALQASEANSHVPYDVVTLLIGVNDQFKHRDTAEYRQHFIECLEKAIYFSGNKSKHVFVLSIPDWGVTPYGSSFNQVKVATAVNRFNAINKDISAAMGVAYIDITPISRQVKKDASMLSDDDLHPSGKQYRLWTNILARIIELKLK